MSSKVKSKMKTEDSIMEHEGGSGGSHNSDRSLLKKGRNKLENVETSNKQSEIGV